jgi:hypothetical protein
MEEPNDDFLDESHDEAQDEIQRLLNEAKRTQLQEQYGMVFSHAGKSSLPPEVEGDWLDHIAEFERQLEGAAQISLREFVGFPEVRAVKDVPDSEIESELAHILDHLAGHEVFIDFPDHIGDAAAYRFVVERLLDEEIMDIRMPGTRLHFIYEEFEA